MYLSAEYYLNAVVDPWRYHLYKYNQFLRLSILQIGRQSKTDMLSSKKVEKIKLFIQLLILQGCYQTSYLKLYKV